MLFHVLINFSATQEDETENGTSSVKEELTVTER